MTRIPQGARFVTMAKPTRSTQLRTPTGTTTGRDLRSLLHVPVVQLNTGAGFGGECHLDANMVRSAVPSLPLRARELLSRRPDLIVHVKTTAAAELFSDLPARRFVLHRGELDPGRLAALAASAGKRSRSGTSAYCRGLLGS